MDGNQGHTLYYKDMVACWQLVRWDCHLERERFALLWWQVKTEVK